LLTSRGPEDCVLLKTSRFVPRELIIIAVMAFCDQLTLNAYRPLIPQQAIELGFDGFRLGLLYGITGLIPFFVSVPVGSIVGNLGVRRVLAGGLWGRILSTAALFLSPSPTMLMLSLVVSMTSIVLIEIAEQTYVSSLGTGRESEWYFGWFMFIYSGGMVVGPLFGGLLADTWGYQVAFLGAALVTAIALPGAYLLPRPKGSASKGIGQGHLLQSVRELLSNGAVAAAIAVVVVLYFALGAWLIYLPAYLKMLGYSSTSIGFVVSAFTLVAMLIRPFLAYTIDLLGRRRLTALLLGAAGVSLIAIPQLQLPVALLGIAAVLGCGRGLLPALSIALVSDYSRPEQKAVGLGLRMMFIRLTSIIYPLVFGGAAVWIGIEGPFYFAGAAALLGGMQFLRSSRFAFARAKAGGQTDAPGVG